MDLINSPIYHVGPLRTLCGLPHLDSRLDNSTDVQCATPVPSLILLPRLHIRCAVVLSLALDRTKTNLGVFLIDSCGTLDDFDDSIFNVLALDSAASDR